MSQEREMIVTRELDVPQGGGWKLTHVRGNDESNPLIFVWVREPVPDAWQDHRTEVCDFIQTTVTLCPSGYEPTGPWEQYAASSDTSDEFTHWRRPLREIEGGEG
jgi:hypothetical protein